MAPIAEVSSTLSLQGLKPRIIQVSKDNIFRSKNKRKYIHKHQRYHSLIPPLAVESDSVTPVFPSISDVIKRFYTCINEKKLTQLDGLISSDCFFPHSFQGKKEVISFTKQLVESMGENVCFRIGTICEGDELTASLLWNLEWKEDQIPFSKGCSIFQCTIEDDRLVIRKAQIITESPIKPGRLALVRDLTFVRKSITCILEAIHSRSPGHSVTAFLSQYLQQGLLKILASLFDEFPHAAKWCLNRPESLFKLVANIYNLLFAPILNPVLTFYITVWKLIARQLAYIISILHIISKFFNEKPANSDPENSD